jgi:hypothetical protein
MESRRAMVAEPGCLANLGLALRVRKPFERGDVGMGQRVWQVPFVPSLLRRRAAPSLAWAAMPPPNIFLATRTGESSFGYEIGKFQLIRLRGSCS